MTVDDNYSKEITCVYKDETFSVRDNGAIMRHSKQNGRKRCTDNIWSFGNRNSQGYAVWCGIRVHQVVATAFHGKPALDTYIVDHIDTNRMNNRPENLRWCSRLENLLNDNTVWNIEYLTGLPIEEILADPSILRSFNLPKDVSAMHAVSPQEASLITAHLKERNRTSALSLHHKPITYPKGIRESLTSNAAQPYDWANYEFPSCPEEEASLEEYYANLRIGDIIAQSEHLSMMIEEMAMNKWKTRICIKTTTIRKDGDIQIKPYGLLLISKCNNYFIHTGSTFFQKDGCEKYYTIARGYKWNGGVVLDDQCQ